MDPQRQQALEELIHRELAKLPERQAPQSLVPGVLARIQARARKHWWQRPWSQWPSGLRLAALPLMLGGALGIGLGMSLLWGWLRASSNLAALSGTWNAVSTAWDILCTLGNAVLILGRAAGQEQLLLWLFVPLSMYLACVGLGTLCYRMALHNR